MVCIYVSFSYIEMMWKMLWGGGGMENNRKCEGKKKEKKEKKEVSIRHLKAYPGGGHKTHLFLRMA